MKFIKAALIFLFISNASAGIDEIYIVSASRLITKDDVSQKIELLVQGLAQKYLSKKVNTYVLERRDDFLSKRKLKKKILLINLVYGFEDAIIDFKLEYPKFNCATDNKIVQSGIFNYKYLLDPLSKKISKMSNAHKNTKVQVLNFWMGGTLKRISVAKLLLGCDLEKLRLTSKNESYKNFQDVISLHGYPIVISNLINTDFLVKRIEGELISGAQLMSILESGLEPLMVTEWN
jgi:hypothetical protein